MSDKLLALTPAALMGLAAVLASGINTQRPLSLRQPLAAAIPREIAGHTGRDLQLDEAQRRQAGMTDYLMRAYSDTTSGSNETFSVYVAYYAQQSLGHTIHSPKNCLPGTGWQALASRAEEFVASDGRVAVNRYIVQQEDQRALVLYWYQGRGRVRASEYWVKLDLLRDAVLERRSEEALVRIVIPFSDDGEQASQLAAELASAVIPALYTALPRWPGPSRRLSK